MSPLTPNNINHMRETYNKILLERSTTVTLTFADSSTKTILALWRQWDTNNPEQLPQHKAVARPQGVTAEAAMEVITEGSGAQTSIGELSKVLYVSPTGFSGTDDWGLSGRYIVTEIQPKSMTWPPARVYVMLAKA